MLTQVEDAPDKAWHDLRKRVKDLGYQLALLEKLNGVKALHPMGPPFGWAGRLHQRGQPLFACKPVEPAAVAILGIERERE